MTGNCPWSVADLLPHSGPAILIDAVSDWSDEHADVSLKIVPGIPFFTVGRGVPVHIGLEYMAQACGVYAGLCAKDGNAPVKIGFLLGTRDFKATLSWFPPGTCLTIGARKIFQHDGMGCFACTILCDSVESATAQLTVYQPDDPAMTLMPRDD